MDVVLVDVQVSSKASEAVNRRLEHASRDLLMFNDYD